MQDYSDFITKKRIVHNASSICVHDSDISSVLYPFQRHVVAWALKTGKASIFADCGLGKTLMQLEWARHVPGDVLIVAPLAVSKQTQLEGAKIGVGVTVCRCGADVNSGVNITNYEMLDHFDSSKFNGVVLDESSVIKNYSGAIRNKIIGMFHNTQYKLACTATPSPNDYMELGNHSELMNNLSRTEMLAMFFTHDGGTTSKWRLKRHAEVSFWAWMQTWSVMFADPGEIGFPMGDCFKLPPLSIEQVVVPYKKPIDGMLFPMVAQTLMERRQARRGSLFERVRICADMVNASNERAVIWCNLNDESSMLAASIDGAVEITGSDSREHKESSIIQFSDGSIKALITKPSIAGFGVNWQSCHTMYFVGLSDSYEQYYQALRRCWRFGQKRPVNVYVITGELEGAVLENIKRKDNDAQRMRDMMIKQLHHDKVTAVQCQHGDIDLPPFMRSV